MKSTADSLDADRDKKKNGLKLDTHKQFEGGETPLLVPESGLSEVSQKSSLPVERTDVSENRESLKGADSYVSDSDNKFNMLTDLSEFERNEILINQISTQGSPLVWRELHAGIWGGLLFIVAQPT